jgi:hypothetical protein
MAHDLGVDTSPVAATAACVGAAGGFSVAVAPKLRDRYHNRQRSRRKIEMRKQRRVLSFIGFGSLFRACAPIGEMPLVFLRRGVLLPLPVSPDSDRGC